MLNSILLQAAPAVGAPGFDSKSLLMWGLIIVVVFFFMILPQRKKSKEVKQFRDSMAAGDRVITAGGIHGKIRDIKENPDKKESVVILEIAEGVRIKIEKSSIFSCVKDEESKL